MPTREQTDEGESRLVTLADAAFEGLAISEGGLLVDANDQLARLLGYTSREELLGRELISFIPVETRQSILEKVAAEKPTRGDYDVFRKDGARLPVEVSGRTIRVSGRCLRLTSVRDLTERKRIEEALQSKAGLLRIILDAVPTRVFWKDTNSVFLGCNQRFANDAGFDSPDQIIGREDAALPWRDQAELYKRDDRRILESGEAKLDYEEPQTAPNGRLRWLRTSKLPLRNPAGDIIGILGTYEDITERKQAHAELEQARNQLAAANVDLEQLVRQRTARLDDALAELEHMAYNMIHEMRAPLRAMNGYAELLLAGGRRNFTLEQQEFAGRIILSATRMDELLTDAIQYSKAVRHKMRLRPVDPESVIRDVIARETQLQTLKATIHLQSPFPNILANKPALGQCFLELLGNALKFAKPGAATQVIFRAERIDPPRALERRIRIWIEDNGIGIDEATLPNIFNMFYQGQNGCGGTGIGLALVRKLAERMGGCIGVESVCGQGSRFWIEFRAAEPAT